MHEHEHLGFLQMCTECQKVGVHVYLANCNGKNDLFTPGFLSYILHILLYAESFYLFVFVLEE